LTCLLARRPSRRSPTESLDTHSGEVVLELRPLGRESCTGVVRYDGSTQSCTRAPDAPMAEYELPVTHQPAKLKKNEVLLIANGDLRLAANQKCWHAQREVEEKLTEAVAAAGYHLMRAHDYKPAEEHGFIGSPKEGMCVFAGIDPHAPLIVAEAVWQYSHHILHGLITHRGPILTVANWSGTWPGLVGLLNLNGSLTKAGVKYSSLWSEDFSESDEYFTS